MSDTIQERLRANYCSCHESYTSRKLTAPDCESCNTKEWREEAADHIDRLEARIAMLEADERRRIAAVIMGAQRAVTNPISANYGHSALDMATGIQNILDAEVKP